ncbi:MAG TPA: hypothetical protein EYP14_06665 [Planctomycetaceae bacterium]|nr:hypothetical protein [Planctomycetaceae bacterium]
MMRRFELAVGWALLAVAVCLDAGAGFELASGQAKRQQRQEWELSSRGGPFTVAIVPVPDFELGRLAQGISIRLPARLALQPACR